MAAAGRRQDTVNVRRQDEFSLLGSLALVGWLADRLLVPMYLCGHVSHGHTHARTLTDAQVITATALDNLQ